MKHSWQHQDEERYCLNCKIREWYDEEDQKWRWISTEEFMDCLVVCESDEDAKAFVNEIS